jgi:ABC-type multidrug transport system ATPase subunit/uncharacterized membrane protein YeiB
MNQRILSLDLIRGFALLGVLAVNAAYYAAPLVSATNPEYGPLSVSTGTVWAWFVPYVFFEYKSIALFSMLFGASLYLVGGDRSEAVRSATLRRRLGWLLLFGMLHGIVLWFGDILLSYALIGLAVMRARSWKPRILMAIGLVLFAASMALILWMTTMITGMTSAERAAFIATSWAPSADALASQVAAYHHGWSAAQMANIGGWIDFQVQTLLFLSLRTAGLMLIGLALFKAGFLSGAMSRRIYVHWLGVGGVALAVLAWNGWDMARQGFPLERVQATGTLVTAGLAPLVAVGYASGLILIVRARLLPRLTAALAATGRMAFTNYLSQSILFSTLCWSGRGLGLYGTLSRLELMATVVVIFAGQMGYSSWWMARHSHGPFEQIWRRLSEPSARSAPRLTIPTAPAVESADLAKWFGSHTAVAGIDLSVPTGAIYGFLGANGAGKTTTIRMMLGLMQPSEGSVRIFGRDVQMDRMTTARATGALLEARATYDHLTGRENLDITRRLLSLPPGEIDRVLTMVDLRHAANRMVGQYSLGMRQRLGLARALIGSPRLLVLDEPMNGLDPDGIGDMRRTICGLPDAAGVTVFLSSHLLSEVEQVATHIGLMESGRLVVQGTLTALLGQTAPALQLRTGNDAMARALLAEAGIAAEFEEAGLILPDRGGAQEAAEVARMLVGAGLELRALTPRQPDLEALYLSWRKRKAA